MERRKRFGVHRDARIFKSSAKLYDSKSAGKNKGKRAVEVEAVVRR